MKLLFEFGAFGHLLFQHRTAPRLICRIVCSVTLIGLLAGHTLAGPYSDLFMFGDSLSDIGNVANSTFGIQPGPFYFDDRFSNGPVYSEMLSLDLGLGPLSPSFADGGNYAFGGAQTTGTGGISGFFIDDIDEQVDDFLSGGPADPDALYVVFAGSNDLLGGETDVTGPVTSLVSDIDRLIAANARKFLVMNLPLLGSAPRFNDDPVESATMTAVTMDFNTAFATALDDLETVRPEATIFRLDVAGLISDVIANPGVFGMTNVTDSAAPGLSPGDSSYDTDLIVSNPYEYLFWDDLHTTTAAHAILAERASAAARLAADFDEDGDVDSVDFDTWQAGFGTTEGASPEDGDADGDGDVDGNDFLILQQQLGVGTASSGNVAVPEPASIALLLTFIGLALARCRMRRS